MNNFQKFLIVVLLCNGWGALFAQKQGQEAIDSILQVLSGSKEDTNKVNLLNVLSFNYYTVSPDEGLKHGLQALELATRLNWEKGIAKSNSVLGLNYWAKSDYTKALDCDAKALSLFEKLGNKKGIASVTSNMGNVYKDQGSDDKALNCYFKSLTLNEEVGDKNGVAKQYCNIGVVYWSQGEYAKSLEYNQKALKLFEETGNRKGIANTFSNMGNVYAEESESGKALEYFFKSLKLDEELGDMSGVAILSGNIGLVYTREKNYTTAVGYFQRSLSVAEQMGDKSLIACDLSRIGYLYLEIIEDISGGSQNKGGHPANVSSSIEQPAGGYLPDKSIPKGRPALLQSAIDYLQKALAIAMEIEEPGIMKDCYECLGRAYKLKGNYKMALENADHYWAIKDSVFSKESNEKIVKLGLKNEYERKTLADSLKAAEKNRIALIQLQKQKGFTFLGVAGILLLAGFSFFIVREHGKSEKERKKSDGLLLNILPAEVAGELKANGSTVARNYDNVTVLFTDFVNFTNAGERMSPQRLIDELHTCFRAFDEITGKYKVEKIKTIGDAYLAVAGLPAADPQHAEHIVKAAIEINTFMQDRLAKLGDRTFDIRIGIHSGNVVAGIVGVKKFAYDIWGDTVNTAARMEQNSEPGKINISDSTYQLVKGKFNCEYRGEISAKNKGMLKMYYVS